MVSGELSSSARAPPRLWCSDRGVVRTECSGPASVEGGRACSVGAVAAATSDRRPIGGLVSACDNVDVATFPYSAATLLRVYVIQSTRGRDDRWLITDVPGARCGYLREGRRTIQLPTATRRLRGVARLVSGDALRSRAWSSATFVESSSWSASARAGLAGRGEREPRTTNVADRGHDRDRRAVGVLLMPFAEERRAGADRLRTDPVGAA